METRQVHRQIHRRYAATSSHPAAPPLGLHTRRRGAVRRWEEHPKREARSPFATVDARAVPADKYKSQHAFWLGVSQPREPESGTAAAFR